MEGIIEYKIFWAIYLTAGLVGLWCWGKIAFWVKTPGLFYHIFSAMGAILIFTPVPISIYMGQQLAPGFVVVAFTLISEGQTGIQYTYLWYGISTVLAFATVFIAFFAGWMPSQSVTKKKNTKAKPA